MKTIKILLVCFGCILPSLSFAESEPLRGYKVSSPKAVDFSYKVKGLNGDEIDLSEYKGKFVILNLWAPWCMPCLSEMPSLNSLAELFENDDDFELLLLCRDEKGMITPQQLVEKANLYYPTFLIDAKEGTFWKQFKAKGLPTTIFIDRDGNEIGRLEGPTEWNHEDVVKLVQSYMEGKGPKSPRYGLFERIMEWFKSLYS